MSSAYPVYLGSTLVPSYFPLPVHSPPGPVQSLHNVSFTVTDDTDKAPAEAQLLLQSLNHVRDNLNHRSTFHGSYEPQSGSLASNISRCHKPPCHFQLRCELPCPHQKSPQSCFLQLGSFSKIRASSRSHHKRLLSLSSRFALSHFPLLFLLQLQSSVCARTTF